MFINIISIFIYYALYIYINLLYGKINIINQLYFNDK